MTRQTARVARCGVHLFIIGVFGTQFALAQVPAAPRSGSNASAPAALRAGTAPVVEAGASTDASVVQLLVGRSTLVDVGQPIARVSLTSADVADALVTSPTQLLVHGKVPGSISMFVWDRSGAVKRFEVSVQRDFDRLSDQVRELFPGERIQVHGNGKGVVLSGQVSSADVADKAVNVAAGYVGTKAEVVTLLQVQPGPRSNQVLLRVRFAEVNRSAMSQYGMSFFTSPTGIKNNVGRVTTQQYSAPNFEELAWTKANGDWGSPVTSAEGKFSFSDFLNVFLLNEKYDLGVLIKALQNRGLFQSLAEPNLVAESGKEASFLAGGEFPVPVAQGSGANLAITVQFKEFGIRLNFTPTVNGDRVHLKVRPEVSTLDYGNAVVLNGFRIPSLSTRRTETELELRNGQTFAIAGLMNNQMQSTWQKVPGIGDIPIIGYLFRSKASQRDQTELVVMITPEILPNDSPGVTPSLPRYPDTFLPPVAERGSHPAPPPAFSPAARSQASDPGTTPAGAAPTTDARTDIERAQDRAQQALDQQDPRGASPASAEQASVPQPIAAKEAVADSGEQTAEQRRLEKQAREQAKKDAKAAERARVEEARRMEAARKEAEKLAREQAKRDAEAAKQQAKRDAEAAKKQAKLDAEKAEAEAQASQQKEAERQALEAKLAAEREAEREQAIEAAAERLRVAEAEYQAELARRSQR